MVIMANLKILLITVASTEAILEWMETKRGANQKKIEAK
jgi:hypothetical protein